MNLSPGARKIVLFAALGVTLAAALLGGGPEEEISEPAKENVKRSTSARKAPPQETTVALDSDRLKRDAAEWDVVDIFATQTWYVAPPPPPPAKPPPPSAPPLPFSYIGKLEEAGATTVFLTRQGINYSVKQGDQIEGTYRIEQISPQAVVLTYLPLNIRQTLPIGAMN